MTVARYVANNGRVVESRRIVLTDTVTGNTFRFCAVCATAVSLVNAQPKTENHEHTEQSENPARG